MKQLIKCCGGCLIYLLWVTVLTAQPAITRIEYYIDNDPGYGKGTSISFTAGTTNLSNIAVNIDPSTLTGGLHIFGIRAKDANNAWCTDSRWLFAKPYSSDSVASPPNLQRIEYYIDNDPGYGKATGVSFTSGNNLSNLALNVDPSSLSGGVHILGIRAKDAKGSWCVDSKWLFAKPYSSDLAHPAPNLNRIEYYIDKDPGYGNATAVSFTPGTNLSDLTINIDPLPLASGIHILGIRAKDANGAWCQDNKWLFAKPNPADTVKAATAPNLKQVEYYIDKDPGYGKGIPVAINSANNLANVSVAINVSGLDTGAHKLFIRSKDVKNSWSLDNVFAFKVDTVISSPSITVNSIVRKKLCQQDSVDVSYQANGNYQSGNTFNVELSDATGSFNAPTIIGKRTSTGNSIIKCRIPLTLAAGTKYKIRISSTKPAVTGLAISDSIKISKLPAPVITPPGTIVILEGDSVKLATTTSYKSYLWSTSAKTATIQAKTYGAYTVRVTDNNSCSATSAPVLVNVTPVIAASGPTTDLCPGSLVTLTSSMATSYKWNTSATTKSIVAGTPGSYYVVVNGGGKGDTSAVVNITYTGCAAPDSLSAANIGATAATLNWGKVTCAKDYQLHYRISGATTWSNIFTTDSNTYTLAGLAYSTKYEWQVRTVCLDSPLVVSGYVTIDSFNTNGAVIASRALHAPVAPGFRAMLYPNPATQNATLQVIGNKTKAAVLITDIAGRVMWQRDKVNTTTNLPVESFSAGTYLVVIKHDNQQEILKLVKN